MKDTRLARNHRRTTADPVYVIRIEGRLSEDWSAWLSGLEIHLEFDQDGGEPSITCLSGPVEDQARLRGILNRIWDLNLTLVSVNRIEQKEG